MSNYGVGKMNHYKQYAPGFFKFFSDFNFNQVIEPFYGRTVDVETYQKRYPNFLMKGIYIAGPCNKERNCGIMDKTDKEAFIDFCKASSNFFDENPM